jgi:hypothetical protein
MIKEQTFLDTLTKSYRLEDLTDFIASLRAGRPARIHTYFHQNIFSASKYLADFVDQRGTVHWFEMETLSPEDTMRQAASLVALYQQRGGNLQGIIPNVNGEIRVSQNSGEIYRIFEPFPSVDPHEIEFHSISVTDWINAIHSLSLERCTLTDYRKQSSSLLINSPLLDRDGNLSPCEVTILDVTDGKDHYILPLANECLVSHAKSLVGRIRISPQPSSDAFQTLGLEKLTFYFQ